MRVSSSASEVGEGLHSHFTPTYAHARSQTRTELAPTHPSDSNSTLKSSLEIQEPVELDLRRIPDIGPADILEVRARDAAHVGARHRAQVRHEPRTRVEVAAIQLVSREKIRLRRDRLV